MVHSRTVITTADVSVPLCIENIFPTSWRASCVIIVTNLKPMTRLKVAFESYFRRKTVRCVIGLTETVQKRLLVGG